MMDIDQEPPHVNPSVKLPGFGLPVDTLDQWRLEDDEWTRFPHAIADSLAKLGITLREKRMLVFINQITDKTEWERKVFDDTIVAKWEKEAVRWDASFPEKGDWWLSTEMFKCCMEELREKAEQFKETGIVSVLDANATVVKCDTAVSSELKDALKRAAFKLEDVPDLQKDWHPGSDEQVLDLVHPSLYPVTFGLTRALPTGTVPLRNCAEYIGKGEVIPKFSAKAYEPPNTWGQPQNIENAWGSFQWLPSDVHFTGENGTASITSYVNNLHPAHHQDLYRVLEQMVDASIPLWNECLSWFHNRLRIDIGGAGNDDYIIPEGVKFPREEYVEDGVDTNEMNEDGEEMEDQEWAEEHDVEDEYRDWWEEKRVLEFPEPEFKKCKKLRKRKGARPIDLRENFAERGLQVIFKLANIHLTPENPTYDGGSWHVEGSLNEHICATAIYYYDCENVTDSQLSFRQAFDLEDMTMKPAQSEYASMEAFYGIEQEGSSVMNLGSVLTKEDRLITFPNVLQHQVQPFSLADNSKPGHRKILGMFLVDPHIQVLSTANVPPQRKDWWADEIRNIGRFADLPKEIFDMVIDAVDDFPISWDDADDIRDQLMEERGASSESITANMEGDTFYFCEH
ncbi:hypothetical protein BU24DRAFT_497902 [Aaosphaeria arxii CBS 175.79]|uniref:Duf1665 domain containing protein n=1 Tax=Aaosphaeria arxii CBS 175.79 TaxID=1450172 RepID=A0A6A5X6D6_9PLEO|nr:uncharacterized protein BU24DRAFT_497902 [Aaosphaeria arxii CBS 175.79]KAF2008441.1 hypothetical protein BU24DRAFT_497902 [Aaosphaeria arxii CBS 175.79]